MSDKVFQKKPLKVRAVQWTGDNIDEVQAFVGVMENMDGDVSCVRFLAPGARDDEGERIFNNDAAHLWVEANTHWVPVPTGQWVLKDPAGFYPCKPDIFAATYDEVPA